MDAKVRKGFGRQLLLLLIFFFDNTPVCFVALLPRGHRWVHSKETGKLSHFGHLFKVTPYQGQTLG